MQLVDHDCLVFGRYQLVCHFLPSQLAALFGCCIQITQTDCVLQRKTASSVVIGLD